MNDMKVVFLDIDGVIQPLGKQDRFKHLDEIEEIAKALDQKIPGFNYYELKNAHFCTLYTQFIGEFLYI